MRTVKVGLLQMALKGDAAWSPGDLRDAMLAAHVPFLQEAAETGVQILGLQELCTQPYFCPSKDEKWFEGAEEVPAGPTTRFMQHWAKQAQMVIVAPVFERDEKGVYYNTAAVINANGSYLGKYRKSHIRRVKGGNEIFYFRPSGFGYPVFDTPYCKLGVYICYDRHFPEGWRALALNGAEYIVNPCATAVDISHYLWELEQPAAAVANAVYIGAVNRIGVEPWGFGRFYGSSYVVNPRGEIVSQGSEDHDELIIADIDLALIQEIRDRWNFFPSRQPASYGDIVRSAHLAREDN